MQGAAGRGSALILEAVPVIRDALLRGRNWRAVAEAAKREHFGVAAAVLARERLEAMVKVWVCICVSMCANEMARSKLILSRIILTINSESIVCLSWYVL